MKSRKRFASRKFGANTLFLLVMSLLLVACAQPLIQVPPLSESTLENVAKLPNPAAVFCEDQGYTYEIRTDADGNQYGVCIFPDGSECDGWAYYRGECTQEQAEATEKIAINIVDEAGLVQTRKITVLKLDPNALTFQKPMISITEPEIVTEIVASLNTDVYLIPRARCPAPFTLRFHLTDGAIQEIGYACELQTPSFLRGGQDFWQGKDVLAPDGFNALLCPHLTRKIKNTLDVFDWSSKLSVTAVYGDVETQIEEAINQLQAAYGTKRSDVTVLGVDWDGYDPFLMAQDIPFAVQVNEPVYDETGASVVVQCNWFGQELPATLTVQLAEEDGVWRITNIIRTKATPPKAPLRTSSSVLPTIFISNHL